MGKQGRKKKRGSTLADKIESRRLRYNNQRLERAILTFFAACDEDDSGFLEAHEFVIAQAVIAEMAGNAFDDDAANDMFADVRKFDKSGDNLVSPKEFKQTMMEMCEVIPRNAEEIIQELAQRTATVAMQMRREVVMVLRKFFKAPCHALLHRTVWCRIAMHRLIWPWIWTTADTWTKTRWSCWWTSPRNVPSRPLASRRRSSSPWRGSTRAAMERLSSRSLWITS
uniref:EF-hand domain-containing protein n=1 Tax=Alexandrium monilatum TaxID=311494 RepID=A0A7S4RTF6_9DINO